MINPPHRPAVFIGSSSEGVKFALAVQAELEQDAEVTTWHQGFFKPGETFIDGLIEGSTRFDFAILLLTPDDLVNSRAVEILSPRDNVIFELGLFMGSLGRRRTFVVKPHGADLKIPSDLAGLATCSYDFQRKDMNYRAAVATASEIIRERIQKEGKRQGELDADGLAGLDNYVVKDSNGAISTMVDACEVTVCPGRIEQHEASSLRTVVLPCNEYFDDECAFDRRSALGAYLNSVFPERIAEFMTLVRCECKAKLGPGTEQHKTGRQRSLSYGPGRALLMKAPLDSKVPIALVSTTTQRAGHGLIAKSSFIFEGIAELATLLADERLNEVVMPILGAGHGGMDSITAFVSLVLALAEAVRHSAGGGRPLRKATIIVFARDAGSAPEIDPILVRRTLAIAGSSSLRREARAAK